MVILAFYTMNFAHPGRLLGRDAMNAKDTAALDKPEQLEMGSAGSLVSNHDVVNAPPPASVAPDHTYSGGHY